MANYNRVTQWQSGQNLTPEDLNAEFDAIAAVVNGDLEESNFQAGVFNEAHIINAGDSRFQTGGLDNAALVAAAISEASAGDIKTVFVPRTLFGYAEEASFNISQFDDTVVLLREGQLGAGFDPVAYGAKPDDAAVDDRDSFQAAANAAEDAAIGNNPGYAFVVVTLPGEYQLDSDVDLASGVGYVEFPGVSTAGAGAIQSADASTDKHGVLPFEGLVHKQATINYGLTSIGAGGNNQHNTSLGLDPDEWMLVYIELTMDEDSGTDVTTGDPRGMDVNTTNLTGTVSSIEMTATAFIPTIEVVNNDGGAGHDSTPSATYFFVKKSAG